MISCSQINVFYYNYEFHASLETILLCSWLTQSFPKVFWGPTFSWLPGNHYLDGVLLSSHLQWEWRSKCGQEMPSGSWNCVASSNKQFLTSNWPWTQSWKGGVSKPRQCSCSCTSFCLGGRDTKQGNAQASKRSDKWTVYTWEVVPCAQGLWWSQLFLQ